MSEKFAHCLRPLFTENLLKDLQAGISLNLVGDHGQGRWRLLEDLQRCALEKPLILAVNMRSYKQSYDGFVSALWQPLGETAGGGDLGSLLTALEKRQQQVIFWLHDFDALLDNPDIDQRYNMDFMGSLNSIKNHYHWSLVCVTSKSYRKYVIIIEGQTKVSPLELTAETLPKLTFEEIRYEVKSRNLPLNSEELALVTKAIHGQLMSYQWLSAIANNLRNQIDVELSVPVRLEKWRKEFRQLQPRVFDVRGGYELSRKIRTWLVAAKARSLVETVIHLVFHPLIVLFEKIVEFFTELVKRRPK
ncbi:MAG: hypothetical protein BWK78_04355 [Thiotrichaceae bacterium IS1]|nr:MAG: hypothetical protein BWK78_04355 [Thiotrichaceae bacterium IS1]